LLRTLGREKLSRSVVGSLDLRGLRALDLRGFRAVESKLIEAGNQLAIESISWLLHTQQQVYLFKLESSSTIIHRVALKGSQSL